MHNTTQKSKKKIYINKSTLDLLIKCGCNIKMNKKYLFDTLSKKN